MEMASNEPASDKSFSKNFYRLSPISLGAKVFRTKLLPLFFWLINFDNPFEPGKRIPISFNDTNLD